ncbi:hypothetical protein EJV47_25320 [Hymenobacter gummosus]|uniref:DNA 3'-5' helicase n=1 Tax=Hymenobacter gummosus TaxID=1776032 RepID=A0A3S0H2D4_9BACT|nr:UvrD-helicase domain-containing protein [Hymenobacter gummosus]RTQ45460.1 hypothetical protein EJV47_25320 [Hymenobacter gummosus]
MKRIGELAYNPVREHIRMRFERVKDDSQRLEAVLRDLRSQAFDAGKSRVLVFVRTRRQAEEAAAQLGELAAELGLAWAEQVDYFHAGLDGFDRERKYHAYQQGRTVVLVATKAFGMGMDIKNIHYVYHLGPSSAFEDFLQEVGRAGRNTAALQAAKFSADNPIRTLCVLTGRDFQLLRDLQHKSALSWEYVLKTQQQIHRYAVKYCPLDSLREQPLALPLDLWQTDEGEKDDGDVRFRLALHWLEQLGRIRLGLFTPAFLPLILLEMPNYLLIKDEQERSAMQAFLGELRKSRYQEAGAVSMPMEELKAMAGKKSHRELFRFLFLAQKIKALSIDRQLRLESTELRQQELNAWLARNNEASATAQRREMKAGVWPPPASNHYSVPLPLVEAVFLLAERLIAPIAPQTQRQLSGDELDRMIREVADEHLMPEHVYWQPLKKNKPVEPTTAVRELREDWHDKRAKFALKLVRLLPNTRLQSVQNVRDQGAEPGVVQLIYNGNRQDTQWRQPLVRLKQRLLALLRYVASHSNQTPVFNYADLVVALELEAEGPDYLDRLLFLARALGYLKGSGSFLPMGIELYLSSTEELAHEDENSPDYRIHQQFLEGAELRKLRLLALECLAAMPQAQQDTFIKKYFACEGSADLVGLLVDHLGDAHDTLKAFRQEALREAEAKLSEEQRRVYDAPLTENLQVIAGPGSGKTHTLTLRVARLIQKNTIQPDRILVLAYNRAVVVELKDRLSTLFRSLGYGQLIKRLHVYTFDGLCRRCLGKELEEVKLEEWVSTLTATLARNPLLISKELGPIEYVFVDEFQDITTERLDMLVKVAPPESVKLCVIGDPNQSIYGYQRADKGQPMNPYPYYQEFERLYSPKLLYLSNNYRSYPDILTAAAQLLADNANEFGIPALQPLRQPARPWAYCELLRFRDTRVDWKDKLDALLQEPEYEPGKRYRQVAVMVRSNDEVFRAFNELQARRLPPDVALRIQGASNSPVTSREFYHLLAPYRENPQAPLGPNYLAEFAEHKKLILQQYQGVWDEYLIHLAHCLVREYRVELEEEATQGDLLEFINDMARRDDGHFMKLYEKHMSELVPEHSRREVVLTTMHKVKGLEFDAVLLPPSFTDFPMKAADPENSAAWEEMVGEERRLLYVAYTRARYRLAAILFDREAAVIAGTPYQLANKEQRLGRIIKPGGNKLFLAFTGQSDATHRFIHEQVKLGAPVQVVQVHKSYYVKSWSEWQLLFNGNQVGKLSSKAFNAIPASEELHGLAVAAINYYTYQESVRFDQEYGTNWTAKWNANAVARGYIYVVDFAGYYKEQ